MDTYHSDNGRCGGEDKYEVFYLYTDWFINCWFLIDFVMYTWLAEDRLEHLSSMSVIGDFFSLVPMATLFVNGADLGFLRFFRAFRALRILRAHRILSFYAPGEQRQLMAKGNASNRLCLLTHILMQYPVSHCRPTHHFLTFRPLGLRTFPRGPHPTLKLESPCPSPCESLGVGIHGSCVKIDLRCIRYSKHGWVAWECDREGKGVLWARSEID